MPATRAHEGVYDVIGVGFGPSNMALAIAIEESERSPHTAPLRARFFERQARFGWHRGMLIDGATMQVSFLKDLVTMRKPTSSFSFLTYLHDKDRLVDFINHKALFPSRVEFHDYLEWAAKRLAPCVSYGSEVVEVSPVHVDGRVEYLDVVVQQGGDPESRETYRTRNIVVAVGLEPVMPVGIVRSERVWHSAEVLDRIDSLPREPALVAVVGAGQSAVEVTTLFHDRFQHAEVRAVFTRYGYSTSDDTPFANQIFDPEAVDDFYSAPADVKRMLIDYHKNTNYSVADPHVINELYRRLYQERVRGERRLHMMRATRVLAARTTPSFVELTVEHLPSETRSEFRADLAVFSTGYRPGNPLRLLGPLADTCLRDSQERLCIARDYRVQTRQNVHSGIYVQGATEYSHGISSSLLSNTAVRAGEIVESLIRRERAAPAVLNGASSSDRASGGGALSQI